MRKELRETLRDRRTIMTLVLMPLLVYPLLSLTFQRFLLSSLQPQSGAVFLVGFSSTRDMDTFARHFAGGRQPEDTTDIRGRVYGDMREHIVDMRLDLGIEIEQQASAGGDPFYRYYLIHRKNSVTSKEALRYVQELLERVNNRALQRRLDELGLPVEQVVQVVPEAVDQEQEGYSSLATLVPLILILMTITGAVYPAIDLTAGERERGTLEMLIAAPVPRFALLIAKYTAALTVAILTATVNLIAMTMTIYFGGLSPLLFGERGLSGMVVLQVFALMVLFAAFFAAVLLAVTSFARSFKEAQAYLIPLMVVAIAPGLLSLMPGLELGGLLSVTPLVNIVLLAGEVFEGRAAPLPALTAIVSTILYAVAAIAVAARVFGADAILYASHSSWSDLWRRPRQPERVATISNALLCLALLFPAYFILSHLLALWRDDMATRLIMAAVVSVFLFMLLPALVALRGRIRWSSGFRLTPPNWLSCLAAAMLALALWPFAHELVLFNERLGLQVLDEQRVAGIKELAERWRQLDLWLVIVPLGIVGPVCEEFFFRGYLLSALEARMRTVRAMIITAILFGLFHIVTPHMLALERFLPSTFLGLVLAWVCSRSASVIPAMVLHACHNSLLLGVTYYSDELARWGIGVQEQRHLPQTWLVAAGCVALAAAALLIYSTKRPAVPSSTADPTEAELERNAG